MKALARRLGFAEDTINRGNSDSRNTEDVPTELNTIQEPQPQPDKAPQMQKRKTNEITAITNIHDRNEIQMEKKKFRKRQHEYCNMCNKSISSRSNMIRHLKRIHGGSKRVPSMKNYEHFVETAKITNLKIDIENINTATDRIYPVEPCANRKRLRLSKSSEVNTSYKIENSTTKEERCNFCGVHTKDHYDMLRHCSKVHFKDYLSQFINEKLQCTFCPNLPKFGLSGLLGHIGAKHKRQEIEKLILDGRSSTSTHIKQLQRKDKRKNIQAASKTQNKFETPASANLQCGHCKQKFAKRSLLYGHYSKVHYRKELTTFLSRDSKLCQFCNILIRKTSDMVAHLGCVHNKLDKFLPNRMKIPLSLKIKKPLFSKNVPIEKKIGENLTKSKNRSAYLEKVTRVLAGGHVCQLCEDCRHFETREDLYRHYAGLHYRGRLEERVQGQETCHLCGDSRRRRNMVLHLGVHHNLVEDFLPEEYHLKKTSKENIKNSNKEEDCNHSNALPPDESESSTDSELKITNVETVEAVAPLEYNEVILENISSSEPANDTGNEVIDKREVDIEDIRKVFESDSEAEDEYNT